MSEHTDAILASLKMVRPSCPICQWPLWQTKLELIAGDQERRSFLCPRCEYEDERDLPFTRDVA
jgi:hypothetical protein